MVIGRELDTVTIAVFELGFFFLVGRLFEVEGGLLLGVDRFSEDFEIFCTVLIGFFSLLELERRLRLDGLLLLGVFVFLGFFGILIVFLGVGLFYEKDIAVSCS